MQRDDIAKIICDRTRSCQTVKERQKEREIIALSFLERFATGQEFTQNWKFKTLLVYKFNQIQLEQQITNLIKEK